MIFVLLVIVMGVGFLFGIGFCLYFIARTIINHL
jgi:hypothetical protein